jgi:hypothetical protein
MRHVQVQSFEMNHSGQQWKVDSMYSDTD